MRGHRPARPDPPCRRPSPEPSRVAGSGHVGHHVVQALDVLHVHSRDDLDPGVQEIHHVLPSLRATCPQGRSCAPAHRRGRPRDGARAPPRHPSRRRGVRGTPPDAPGSSGDPRASRSSSGGRLRLGGCDDTSFLARPGGGLRRASRRSCRPPGRRPVDPERSRLRRDGRVPGPGCSSRGLRNDLATDERLDRLGPALGSRRRAVRGAHLRRAYRPGGRPTR